ncbi:Regulator of rDNA transcription protein 15 [Capsicum baccatum]|uniref:Regulator of rDNA transcription protein 15 n=1 Tax=Capsicum baccatum TaxID=33114 RepID=A0A2G2UYT6_CAPBA|nr:Regulator of rDNA transcription protein 15 [Capsicum baccatum]
MTGLSPSLAPPSRGLGPGPPLRTLLQTTIRTTEPPDSKAGLFPIRSPLLRESFALVPWCLGATVPRRHDALVPWPHAALVPWCQGAMVPQCIGATVPVCHGAMVPRCLCAKMPWCHSACVTRCHGAAPPRCHGTKVPRCHGSMVPWCLGAMAPRCLDALVPWCHGATVPWCHGATVPWCLGAMVPWRHGAMAPRCLGATVPWCLGAMAPRCQAALVPRCTDIQLDKDTTMAGHYTSVGVRHWRRLQYCTRRSQKPLIAACLHAPTLFSVLRRALMPYSESRKSSSCDAVVFRERPLHIGKTNLSHDGLNPAHVPYWWVNNPTLGEFCFTMIGRADIEGSKSNVAMNAWLPQASYPCGNFSDTSSFEFRRSKGSLGHAFTVRIRTGNENQKSFYPSVPHEISVLVELILGHLRYLLTDVPPQPNSPPDNVFRPDRPIERALGPKRGAVPRFRFTE